MAVCVLGLLLGAFAAGADEQPPAPPPSPLTEVLARLDVGDPAHAAWAAYLAGRDGHHDAVPRLEELLVAHLDPFSREWNLAHRAALDALVRLDASPSGRLLRLHERRFPIHVLILRSRAPARHAEALEALLDRLLERERVGLYGVAVGNLLAGERVPGIAALLMTRIPLALHVQVYTPGPGVRLGGGARGMAGGSGDAVARVPPGFPPFVHYRLWAEDGEGRVLVARGPQPVWYGRTEREAESLITGLGRHDLEVAAFVLGWIAAWLDVPVRSLGVETKRSLIHPWTSAKAYVGAVSRAREALLAGWWDVARRLLAAGLLTPDEMRRLEPSLTIHTTDRRTTVTGALPALPPPVRPAPTRPEATR